MTSGDKNDKLTNEHLTLDELLILNEYRKTRDQKHAEGAWAVKDGRLVKLETVEKKDLSNLGMTRLREGFIHNGVQY